jgi:hypothetical protein
VSSHSQRSRALWPCFRRFHHVQRVRAGGCRTLATSGHGPFLAFFEWITTVIPGGFGVNYTSADGKVPWYRPQGDGARAAAR